MLINSSFFEDEELIDFNNTHISTSCVGSRKVVFVHPFGLSNYISSLFFLLLLFSDLKIDSFQGDLKHGAWETIADFLDFLLQDVALLIS